MIRQGDEMEPDDPDPYSIQRMTEEEGVPSDDAFIHWLRTALADQVREKPLDPSLPWVSLRIVDAPESRALNCQWRGRDYATNVLSFPASVAGFLGDIVLCAPVVAQEAAEQHKPPQDHWAHLVVHGVLHLCGMDHQSDSQAEAMEAREALILDRLGIINPYINE